LKKSQIITLDFITATFIFIGLLIFIFWTFNHITIKQYEYRESNELNMMALQISENLISVQGYPNNWHTLENLSEVQSIGFKSGNEINFNKIKTIDNFNYTEFKKKVGAVGPGYELGIKIYDFDGADFQLNSSYGNFTTAKSILIQRNVIIDGKFARINLYLGVE
jgi:hypothetical protein